MTGDHNALLVGLPGTGKTSFLAILYLAINSESRCTVRLADFDDDRRYVNTIAEAMIRCNVAKRTEVSAVDGLSIGVLLPDDTSATLRVPDVSGETWQAVLEDRSMPDALWKSLADATSILMFVHVDEFTTDPSIAELDRVRAALGDSEEALADDSDSAADSSQVQLVDLLQVISTVRGNNPGRISLMLSAFDTVSDTTPDEWIRLNAPLVHQFLTVNQAELAVDIYGLSAQGGEFKTDASVAHLIDKEAVERAFMLSADGKLVDFDTPIIRAMSNG